MSSEIRLLPKDLGLKGLYSWSAPGKTYTEDELISIVLPRAHYTDVLRLCAHFGIDKIKQTIPLLNLHPRRLEQLSQDVKIIEDLSEQAKSKMSNE